MSKKRLNHAPKLAMDTELDNKWKLSNGVLIDLLMAGRV
jgi:hypothetical protein